jgi:hypothetical protein
MIKPQFFCANDDLRPALQHVAINHGKEPGWLAATDSYIAIKARMDECLPDCVTNLLTEPCFILGKDFAQLQNLAIAEFVTVRGRDYISGVTQPKGRVLAKDVFVKVIKTPDWKFPDVEAVMPRADRERTPVSRIGLKASYLNIVQKALGKVSLTLDFTSESHPIVIPDGDNGRRYSVIVMPVWIYN